MWPSPQGRRLEDSEPPCWTSGSRTGTPPPVAEEDCGTCGLPHPRTRGGFRLGQALHGPPRSAGLGGRRVLVSPRGTGAEPLSLGGPGGPAQPETLPERAVTLTSPSPHPRATETPEGGCGWHWGGGRANSLRRRQTASSEAAGVQAEGDAAGGAQEGAGGADPRAGAAAGAVAAKLNPGETRESWHGPKARSRGPWGTGSRPRETPPATPPSDTLPARVCECRSNRCVSECGARKQKTLFSRAHGTRL